MRAIEEQSVIEHIPVTGRSAVYAIGRPAKESAKKTNPFEKTVCITLPENGLPPQLDVYAGDETRVLRCFDAETGRAIYAVGKLNHATLTGDEMLKWCANTAQSDPQALRTLLGHFVLLIDDRRGGSITVITDVLAARPWLTGKHDGRFVGGTEVFGICDAGLSNGRVNYDSILSWLAYNYDCTKASLVQDYGRLPGGTITTFTPAGEQTSQTVYAAMQYGLEKLSPDDTAERLYSYVEEAVERLLNGVDELNIPLSGGYDSRLLAMLASKRTGTKLSLTTVQSTPQEVEAGRRVAEALKQPHRVIGQTSSTQDFYDDPLWFRPEGFPTSRNLTNAVARLQPGVPILSGYLGDIVMRLSMYQSAREYLDKDYENLDDMAYCDLVHDRYLIRTNPLDLLKGNIGARLKERGTTLFLDSIQKGRQAGRPLSYTNVTMRQGRYFSGIFLSHADVAEALTPFYSWNLIDFSSRYCQSMTTDTYARIFARHAPALGEIPHNTQLPQPEKKELRPRTRHLQTWAKRLLPALLKKPGSTAIDTRKLLKRLPSALIGQQRYESQIGFLYKIWFLEQRARRANIDLNWAQM